MDDEHSPAARAAARTCAAVSITGPLVRDVKADAIEIAVLGEISVLHVDNDERRRRQDRAQSILGSASRWIRTRSGPMACRTMASIRLHIASRRGLPAVTTSPYRARPMTQSRAIDAKNQRHLGLRGCEQDHIAERRLAR